MGEAVVDTYRVIRRQDMGGGRWRENGELLPEAHLFFAAGHWVHTGSIEEVKVSEADFREAVQEFCPDRAPYVYEAVGLAEGVISEGPHRTPRSAPLLPARLPEKASDQTVSTPPVERTSLGSTQVQAEVTTLSHDPEQNSYSPVPGPGETLLPKEES